MTRTLTGGCHCGNLKIRIQSGLDMAQFNPRACDCSFCTKHGASYFSDAAGNLEITIADNRKLGSYRQGSKSAELLFCLNCGVLVGVVYEENGDTYGAVNAACLSPPVAFAAPVTASPQHLSAEAKSARWRTLWFRNVKRIERI